MRPGVFEAPRPRALDGAPISESLPLHAAVTRFRYSREAVYKRIHEAAAAGLDVESSCLWSHTLDDDMRASSLKFNAAICSYEAWRALSFVEVECSTEQKLAAAESARGAAMAKHLRRQGWAPETIPSMIPLNPLRAR